MALNKSVIVVSGVALALLFYWLMGSRRNSWSKDDVLSGIKVQPELEESSKLLPSTPTVVKVMDGVYVAVGFAAENSIMLEGSDGLIIVDTAEGVEVASEILREFRKITSKPIRAIVYTHNHADHISGSRAFVEDAEHPPEIWAHQSLKPIVMTGMSVGAKTYRGIVHQFGLQLGQYMVSFFNLRINVVSPSLPLFPTRFVDKEATIAIPGLNVTLLHVPGETSDHIVVWAEKTRVLMTGDNIYSCFPNLYAVRGSPPRSSVEWAEAVRRMRTLQPKHLVFSHGLPVSGSQTINDILTTYMLGIYYVHDQTVRLINRGLHPDEIARQIQLPSSLATHPYLRQCYGMTGWSAKGIYEEYVGWFSGDPVELQPLTPRQRAERMVRLVGERELVREAKDALKQGEWQWALELSTMVLRIDPDNIEAKEIRVEALRNLAGDQINPTARNFYMTAALDDVGLVDWKVDQTKIIEHVDMPVLMNLLRFKLKAEEVDGVNITTVIRFTDTRERYRLHIFYSVLDVEMLPASAEAAAAAAGERNAEADTQELEEEDGVFDVRVVTTSEVWREIIAKKRSPAMALASGDVRVEGGVMKFREFFSYFQQ